MRRSSLRRSRKSGSIMLMGTLILPFLLIPLAGLAIDATVARLAQIRLQAAVDGAALGAGRLLGATADIATLAGQFLRANFRTDRSAGTWNVYGLQDTEVFTDGLTQIIDIKATALVPLIFLRVLGFRTATIAAVGRATHSSSRVMFVLDRSGSMSGVIGTTKDNAEAFVRQFTPATDELGLVVFDGSAVVGYPTYAAGGWTPDVTMATNGGPVRNFLNTTDSTKDLPTQIQAVGSGGGTGMAEALWLAYLELQKAHLRDFRIEGKPDTRVNSIVLLTDGVPTGISLYYNDPRDINGVFITPVPGPNSLMLSTCGCTNRIIPAPTVAKPNPDNANTMMKGWIAVSGGPDFSTAGNAFTAGANSSAAQGISQQASVDTTYSSLQWMAKGGVDAGMSPVSTPYTSCASAIGPAKKLSRIPKWDLWRNDMTGTRYTASNVTSGSVSAVDVHGAYDATTDSPYNWALAMWNATDDAARRIRVDSNYAARQAMGDTSDKMSIGVYVIGYTGNGGVDDGLLKRLANDPRAVGYVAPPAQRNGRYYEANNPDQMAEAMNKVASDLLRLAR